MNARSSIPFSFPIICRSRLSRRSSSSPSSFASELRSDSHASSSSRCWLEDFGTHLTLTSECSSEIFYLAIHFGPSLCRELGQHCFFIFFSANPNRICKNKSRPHLQQNPFFCPLPPTARDPVVPPHQTFFFFFY